MKKYIELQIDLHLQQADKLALEEVERIARKLLRKHKKYHEFIMGMGTFFFTDSKNKEVVLDHLIKDNKIYKELHNFIFKYNGSLKLTGEPMRFTVDGPLINDW